jgi:hypothetical protein
MTAPQRGGVGGVTMAKTYDWTPPGHKKAIRLTAQDYEGICALGRVFGDGVFTTRVMLKVIEQLEKGSDECQGDLFGVADG